MTDSPTPQEKCPTCAEVLAMTETAINLSAHCAWTPQQAVWALREARTNADIIAKVRGGTHRLVAVRSAREGRE